MVHTSHTARHYLSTDHRQKQLLEAAAELVDSRGWSGLTMTGLAQQAGVSRQLVYEHFSDRAKLFSRLLYYKFESIRELRDQIRDSDSAPDDMVRHALGLLISIPKADRSIVRSLFHNVGLEGPEFVTLREEMREEMIGNWIAIISQVTGHDQQVAGALAWAIIQTIWGFGDAVDDGRMSLDAAQEMVAKIVNASILAVRVQATAI